MSVFIPTPLHATSVPTVLQSEAQPFCGRKCASIARLAAQWKANVARQVENGTLFPPWPNIARLPSARLHCHSRTAAPQVRPAPNATMRIRSPRAMRLKICASSTGWENTTCVGTARPGKILLQSIAISPDDSLVEIRLEAAGNTQFAQRTLQGAEIEKVLGPSWREQEPMIDHLLASRFMAKCPLTASGA